MNLKHLSVVLFVSALLLSCGGNKSSEDSGDDSPGISEAISGFKNLNKVADATEDWEEKQKELAALTPLTNDEIKALLPESLSGMKRTKFTVGDASMMGLVLGQATYSDGQDKSVELSIIDGAGETGSGMIAIYVMALSMEMEEETETGFSKTTTIDGHRATVEEERGEGWINSEIASLVSDRYLVTLNGTGLSYNELGGVFKALDFGKFK